MSTTQTKLLGTLPKKTSISMPDHKLQLRIRPMYPIPELRGPIILGWRIDYDMRTYPNDYLFIKTSRIRCQRAGNYV